MKRGREGIGCWIKQDGFYFVPPFFLPLSCSRAHRLHQMCSISGSDPKYWTMRYCGLRGERREMFRRASDILPQWKRERIEEAFAMMDDSIVTAKMYTKSQWIPDHYIYIWACLTSHSVTIRANAEMDLLLQPFLERLSMYNKISLWIYVPIQPLVFATFMRQALMLDHQV